MIFMMCLCSKNIEDIYLLNFLLMYFSLQTSHNTDFFENLFGSSFCVTAERDPYQGPTVQDLPEVQKKLSFCLTRFVFIQSLNHLDSILLQDFVGHLMEFLRIRGIDERLAAFIVDFNFYKEQREYMGWLRGLHKFVSGSK